MCENSQFDSHKTFNYLKKRNNRDPSARGAQLRVYEGLNASGGLYLLYIQALDTLQKVSKHSHNHGIRVLNAPSDVYI